MTERAASGSIPTGPITDYPPGVARYNLGGDMDLRRVSEPHGLTYPCIRCGKRTQDTDSHPVSADLDGIPFRAYYCAPCAQIRAAEREASGVILGPITENRA